MLHSWEMYQGCYVHIPFCQQKCCYCDFISYQGQSPLVMERYTHALCREIASWQPDLPIAGHSTIYFGGGTPSFLPLPLLERVVMALKERGFWKQPAEATLEANPGTVTRESLAAYRKMGFDRLSLGIQSLDDRELRLMGRIHSAEEAERAFREAREAGFTRISVDLIYGYPTQTIKSLRNSLQRILAWNPDHVSVYGLSVEPGTILADRLKKKVWQLPSEEESGRMYDELMETLPQAGYNRYEISNFAKPGQESIHNRIYWHYEPYMAFGAGACRFNGKKRETNPGRLPLYIEGKNAEPEALSEAIRREELVFMNLRTAEGLDLHEYEVRTGESFLKHYAQALEQCKARGWMVSRNGHVVLTDEGMRFGNRVFEVFVD